MLVKRNPDIESYKLDYENWKKEAQEYRVKLKKDLITNEEFEKWLDNNLKKSKVRTFLYFAFLFISIHKI